MGKYADQLLTVAEPGTDTAAGKYSSRLLGVEPTATPDAARRPQPGNRQQPAGFMDMIRGQQDPAYADIGTVYEQNEDDLRSPTATAAMMGASDAQMADIIQNELGDRVIRRERDANGNPVLVTRGPDGQERKGYVNKPGLDSQDVWRTIYGVAPYLATGGAAGAALKGTGAVVNALGQGAAAGLTSLAGDVAQVPMGSQQGVELDKAAITAGVGAAAVPVSAGVSALWRRFVTVPGLFDKATGKLTAAGAAKAKQAGLNPGELESHVAEQFAKSYARTGDAQASAVIANTDGIPATRGQVTKRPDLLDQEERMRRNLYGDRARQIMEDFDTKQRDAIARQALGSNVSDSFSQAPTGIGERLQPARAPNMVPSDRSPASLGESARSGLQEAQRGARSAESNAWAGTRDLAATKEALDTLPEAINSRLGDVVVDEAITPMAARMGKELEAFVNGSVPTTSAGIIKGTGVQSVDQMRRRLGSMAGSTATNEDRRAAGAVYDAFNDWIGDAAEKSLLSGNPEAAMNIVKARGFSREVKALFSPKAADGRTAPAAQRISKVLDDAKADSGEAVVNALFGSTPGSAKAGTVQAVQNIKSLLERFAPETGKTAWNDIRLAYWTRLVLGKDGNMAGPQAIASNIKKAMQSESSVMSALYSNEERRSIANFLRQIELVAYKPPNPSGSGYTVASVLKEGVLNLLNAFGVGRMGAAALEKAGVTDVIGATSARSAVKYRPPTSTNALAPALTGAGSAYPRQD